MQTIKTYAIRFFTFTLVAIAGLGLFAGSVLAETHTVKMGSDNGRLVYVPETLEIQPGDTVEWVMNKIPPHNVNFEADAIPGNKALAQKLTHQKFLYQPGQSYTSTFSESVEPGVYSYYCQPHLGAGMKGKIIVSESD